MDGNGCGEKQLWTILKCCRNILHQWLGKITRNLSGDSLLPKTNPDLPKHDKYYCVCTFSCIALLKPDGTSAETRFCLSPKWTSPFKSAGESVQSTAGSRGVRISVSSAGCTTFRGSVRVLATHSIRQFPLHFPSRASPCAIRFQTSSTKLSCS